MKKLFILIILLNLFGLLFSESITKIYNFEKPILQKIDNYVKINYKNCINYGKEKFPELPHYNINLLLPKGEEIDEINIKKIEFYDDISEVIIKPASAQFPISKPNNNYQLQEDRVIYQSKIYPKSIISKAITGFLSGHSIGSFEIIPIVYRPKEKKIIPIKKIEIEVKTLKTDKAVKALELFNNDTYTEYRLKKIVSNFEDYSYYYPKNFQKNRDDQYDLLLITSEELLPAFDDYINYKTSVGYFVAIKITQDIYNEYTGVDNQEKIRNCILDYYQNFGIKYVILGGDADTQNQSQNIVPVRGMTVIIGNPDYDEYNLPSDIYYSNLDGNWNDDNDNNWGENGEIDFYSEISVGRISADTQEEVLNFTNKIIMYSDQPVIQDIEKSLMLGELLDDTPTYGGNYKDEIADGSDNNDYHTNPIPDNFSITKLYDRDSEWSKNDVFNQFGNVGINLLNHLGHSSPTYNMRLENADLTINNLSNNGISRGFVIGYSQGCYNGSFDNWIWNGYYLDEDCFAENITDLATGEVASIANSRYGWYSPGETNSSSQYYDRQFFNTVFYQNIYKIGRCNSFAKEIDVMLIANNPYYKWSAFETNLLGDPSMDIWTEQPTDFEMVSYPQSINIGAENLEVILSELNCNVSVIKDGELLGRVFSNESAIVNVEFNHPIEEVCQLTVVVTGHNKNKYTGTLNVLPGDSAFLYPIDFFVNEMEGIINQIPEHGEYLGLYYNIKNLGSVDAENVVGAISVTDSYVSIEENDISFGNINTGENVQNSQPFGLRVSPYCPDEHVIQVDLNLSSDQGNWLITKTIPIKSPKIILNSYSTFTNDVDYLLPGLTGHLKVNLKNIGSGNAHLISAQLSENDDYISLIEDQSYVQDIFPNESLDLEQDFLFNVSDECPAIYNFNFTLEITDSLGYYTVLQIPIEIGYKNTVEDGEQGWTHYSLNQMPDQWHISDSRYNSFSHSWKVGSNGSSNYFNNIKCALETSEIDINPNSYLSFYHWMNAETSSGGNGNCYDGGLVEIYFNQNWLQLVPIGGYPFTTIGNNNPPFENGTGVFSGLIDWERVYFDLSEFSGTVKFRFIFGSDGAVASEGWYIDDFSIVSSDNAILPPKNLYATQYGDTIILNWENQQDDVEFYNIYRKRENNFYEFINSTNNTTFADIPTSSGIYFYVVTAVKNGSESIYSNCAVANYQALSENEDVIENKFELMQNYPNPFNPKTKITFSVSSDNKRVSLEIFNLKGQKVKTLINKRMSKGMHTAIWNGKNSLGKSVSSGVYFYKLSSGKQSSIKKMILLK